ncbi:MAG: thiamine phosphate synthase [Bacillota bacterium]
MNNKFNYDLYGITAEKYSRGRDNIQVVEEMIAAGIKIIQYREKEKSMREKYEECRTIRQMTEKEGVDLLINDHLDLALMVDADGVHLGQKDLPPREARKILGPEKIIGLSTHSPAQAQNALQQEVDYIGVGPIFSTSTKKNVCDPVGLEYLEYVVENIDLPFVAIGGIKEHNIEQVWEKGASCVALVTEIVGAKNIQEKISSLRSRG